MVKQKQKPFFSITTVCYNEEKSIRKTCESISNQKFKDFEWIVVDGRSTDGTVKIIKEYKKDIASLTSEKDDGIYNAMNKGIKKSKGEYLLFLNGGDYLKDKDTLQKVHELIQEDKGSNEIYYGDLLYDNGEIVRYDKAKLNEKFFVKSTLSHQATFIDKKLFNKFGNYNENYHIVSDFEFWVKAIVKGKVKTKHLPIVIAVFDLSGMSTDYKLAKKQIKERNDVLMKYKLINKKQATIAETKWLLLTTLKKAGLYNLLRKNYRKVIRR